MLGLLVHADRRHQNVAFYSTHSIDEFKSNLLLPNSLWPPERMKALNTSGSTSSDSEKYMSSTHVSYDEGEMIGRELSNITLSRNL